MCACIQAISCAEKRLSDGSGSTIYLEYASSTHPSAGVEEARENCDWAGSFTQLQMDMSTTHKGGGIRNIEKQWRSSANYSAARPQGTTRQGREERDACPFG
ncbi:hypothetical protein GCM10009585_07870 [Brevibacterium paucivorans]